MVIEGGFTETALRRKAVLKPAVNAAGETVWAGLRFFLLPQGPACYLLQIGGPPP